MCDFQYMHGTTKNKDGKQFSLEKLNGVNDFPFSGKNFMPLCHDLAPIDSLEGSKCFRIGVPVEKKEGNIMYTTSRLVLHELYI